ncbi:MAG: hypothetical protein ACREBZ_04025 [Thermoplasmata archaeon]
MSLLAPAPLLLAFVITLLEMTEVVLLIFALGIEHGSVRHGAMGAAAGVALVAGVAAVAGATLAAIPSAELLAASAIVLAAFGVFLFRSTLRSYRRARQPASERGPPPSAPVHFAAGFTVGAVEATEAVAVLVPLAAGGAAGSALVGALAAGAVLAICVALVHERIRRIKAPWLKLGATSLLFAFATFWGGEALGLAWPAGDVFLIPLFVVALLLVRAALGLALGERWGRTARA